MKFLLALSLLFINYQRVRAYSDCQGCHVISVEEGYEWGIENDDWCISKYLTVKTVKKKDRKKKLIHK